MYILNVLKKKNLKTGKSPEKNYYPGENLANRHLGNTKKMKKEKNTKKLKNKKSAIDENLVNRRHGSKRFLPKKVKTW